MLTQRAEMHFMIFRPLTIHPVSCFVIKQHRIHKVHFMLQGAPLPEGCLLFACCVTEHFFHWGPESHRFDADCSRIKARKCGEHRKETQNQILLLLETKRWKLIKQAASSEWRLIFSSMKTKRQRERKIFRLLIQQMCWSPSETERSTWKRLLDVSCWLNWCLS